jgi:hypothetical protein
LISSEEQTRIQWLFLSTRKEVDLAAYGLGRGRVVAPSESYTCPGC